MRYYQLFYDQRKLLLLVNQKLNENVWTLILVAHRCTHKIRKFQYGLDLFSPQLAVTMKYRKRMLQDKPTYIWIVCKYFTFSRQTSFKSTLHIIHIWV